MWMACLTLLLIVILTTVSKVTSLHCSHQQIPASGDDDLQQVTILQYCRIDNCTIKMIDTGEKLDITYTTDSLIVTTPMDGRTSMMIAKDMNELSCVMPETEFLGVQLALMMIFVMISGYMVAVHLIFKELRNTGGKLLMLYNLAIVCFSIAAAVQIIQFKEAVNSLPFCYIVAIVILISGASIEALATCILHQIAYIMYSSKKLRAIQLEESKQRFTYYMIYVLGTAMFTLFLMICYDLATGDYKALLQPDGHCIDLYGHPDYGTAQIGLSISAINKMAQFVLFIAYLYYMYKLNKNITNPAVLEKQQPLLRKIGTAMGAVVGLAYLMHIVDAIFNIGPDILVTLIFGLFLTQQCVILAIFMCSKKIRRLFGECLKKE